MSVMAGTCPARAGGKRRRRPCARAVVFGTPVVAQRAAAPVASYDRHVSATFDLPVELRAGLGDRGGAWRFVEGFAASWSTPLGVDDGCPPAELAAVAERLGLPLPAAVREAYTRFGRRPDLTSNQDVLLAPAQLAVDEQVLVFRTENQRCARWGVRVAELADDDPPVVWRPVGTGEREPWQPYLDRFSVACVELVLSESLFAGGGLADNRPVDEAAVDQVASRYDRLALPAYPMWAMPAGPPVRWFGGADVVLRDDGCDWLWMRARTPQALAAARAAVPGEWLLDAG
jgi:hypothetical protein